MKTSAVVVIVCGLAVAVLGQSPAKAKPSAHGASMSGMKFWNTDQGKWIDAGGLHEMVVSGDQSKPGSVTYLKADPGAKLPWHWHTGPEIVYGDGGSLEVHTLKGGHKMTITSGSYARMPGHMIHNAVCVSQEPCTFYIESPQVFDYHEVDENGKEIKPAAAESGPKK